MIRDSDAVSGELVEPARPRPGVCSKCRTWSDTATDQCYNCTHVEEVFDHPAMALSLISLYRKPSDLREWITGYKGRVDGSEPVVTEYQRWVRAILGRFLLEHGQVLSDHLGAIDAVTVVPSTDRKGVHPLRVLLDSLDLDVPTVDLLRRGPGELNFNRPARDGYLPVCGHRPLRVLVIDDVYTTGARLNSAAYGLRRGGNEVAGGLVVARRVNLGFRPNESEPFWANQSSVAFDWSRSPIAVD